MNKRDAVSIFKRHHLDTSESRTTRRTKWCFFVDGLHRDGLITYHQVMTWAAPPCVERSTRAT